MGNRIRDWGLIPGRMETGQQNAITDVPGVRVGHYTVHDLMHCTGVTAVIPRDDIYYHRCTAACAVINGFGKSTGLIQVEELGQIETPILLTNTLNVGLVYDAVVAYTAQKCRERGEFLKSVNPVVGECNDGTLNKIRDRMIGQQEVLHVLEHAMPYTEEGCVGAGAGMVCHGLKGGIGSASRIIREGDHTYTIGMLALCNHGVLEELNILGIRPGAEIRERIEEMEQEEQGFGSLLKTDDSGSCMIVLATDMPLSSRQLKRVIKRSGAGLARCGSFWGHGSGDIAIGFTTAHDLPRDDERVAIHLPVYNETKLDAAFAAAAECAEECVLNALSGAVREGHCHCLEEFHDIVLKR